MQITKFFLLYMTIAATGVALVPAAIAGEVVKVGGTGGALGTMRALGQAFKTQYPQVDIVVVPGLGSGGGRRALMAGALDVAVTARPLAGVERVEGAQAKLYGRSPFILAVAPKTPVVNVTLQDVVEIYGGKKITWSNGERLRLILKPETDSDSELLRVFSPDVERALRQAFAREGIKIAITDEECADVLQATPGAVGTSTMALLLSEKRGLKALALNGVAPSVKTVSDGSYPWFKSFYLLTRGNSSSAAKQFVEFSAAPQAQKMLASFDYLLPGAPIGR